MYVKNFSSIDFTKLAKISTFCHNESLRFLVFFNVNVDPHMRPKIKRYHRKRITCLNRKSLHDKVVVIEEIVHSAYSSPQYSFYVSHKKDAIRIINRV